MAQNDNEEPKGEKMELRARLGESDTQKLREIMKQLNMSSVTEGIRVCIGIAHRVYVKKEH